MDIKNFSTTAIGRLAVATGITVILAVVLLILMYTVSMSFGKVNDAFNALIGVASLLLAWMLYPEHHARSPWMSRIVLLLAFIGAIFTVIGSTLIIFDFTGFLLAGWYSGIGFALIGLWLAALCYSLLHGGVFPRGLVILGLLAGACMGIGLLGISGIFSGMDDMQRMPLYLYVAFLGWLGTYVLYPIWSIWLGRNLLHTQ